VHRHFETKEKLVREVLDRADARLFLLWNHLTDAKDVARFLLGHREPYQHALLVLESAVMDGVTEGVPSRLVDGLIDRLQTSYDLSDQEASAAAVTAVVLLLGWATYGKLLSSADHLTCEADFFESGVAITLDQVLSGDLGQGPAHHSPIC
jgi:AcrR family transcriptional regulator